MERFTFYKEYYDKIQRLKKPQDRAYLSLAVMEFIFEDKIPENMPDAVEMAFEILYPKLLKSKNNSGRGGRPKTKTDFENGFQKLKPNCETVSNRFSKTETERKTVPNEKERSKEKDYTLKKEIERKKEIDINIISNSACACDGKNDKTLTYENIISHYAGDIDAETRAAIWKYIQFFQAKTGCFIMNEQLKVFLQNLKNNGLLFEGAILGCLNNDGIGMAMMELNDYDSVHGEENQGNK